jgi:monoamine oxidase
LLVEGGFFAMSQVTRRRFFQHVAAIGGTSALMNAMTSLELLAEQVAPRPQWSGTPSHKRVLVLGAGLSGLVAGYELGKLGYDCQLLEARERVGGVSWTIRRGTSHREIGSGETQLCTFAEGEYFNAGPWRIPHGDHGVLDYCKELGVALEIFVNENDASYFYYEKGAADALGGKRIRLREVKADLAGYTNELLAKAIDQRALDLPLSKEDGERLVAFLVSEGYLDSADRVYKGSAARGTGDPLEFVVLLRSGFGNRLRSVPSGTGAAPMFQPVGGMDMIPKAFQRVLAERITLGAEVKAVHQTGDDVRVRYVETKTGTPCELRADYVVVCLPLTVLRTIDINLSPPVMEVVKDTTYSASAKMGLQMRRRFWEEDDGIYGGHLYSDLPLGEFSYPSNGLCTRGGVLMGFYGNGRMAGLHEQPVGKRVEHVLTHAAKVHPQIRAEYTSAYAIWWDAVQYSQGAYAAGGTDRVARLSTPGNRLFIGCAAAHRRAAWQQGAIEAAWQAVSSLHDRAMRG